MMKFLFFVTHGMTLYTHKRQLAAKRMLDRVKREGPGRTNAEMWSHIGKLSKYTKIYCREIGKPSGPLAVIGLQTYVP